MFSRRPQIRALAAEGRPAASVFVRSSWITVGMRVHSTILASRRAGCAELQRSEEDEQKFSETILTQACGKAAAVARDKTASVV